ncbi:hypothetical protein [Jeotgalicoccus sp. WY2]|uniref:hypothetical protein n=1 Tax=Jeotgalicoccus sp. WY2 TaxID=2708346 RepID=UPI001BD22755|nr:hypothetical protein [Jeotgalicoccus sp. WY2]
MNTKKWIYDQIKDLGLDIRQDVGGNGIVARLQVNDDFDTVALRADFLHCRFTMKKTFRTNQKLP